MGSLLINPNGKVQVTLASGQALAVWTVTKAAVTQVASGVGLPGSWGKPNYVTSRIAQVFTPASYPTTYQIDAFDQDVFYEVGTAPVVLESLACYVGSAAAGILNATGALTAALMFGKIITSSTAAAVTGTLPTGAVLDATTNLQVGDAVEWGVVNTGATNAFTVAAASGHTIVGNAVVALSTSGRFVTVKTAAATYITYRLS